MVGKGRLLAIVGAVAILGVGIVGGLYFGHTDVEPQLPSTPPPPSASAAAATSATALAFTMSGAFDLFVPPDSKKLADGTACRGTGTYGDINLGTAVTVYNATGQAIAKGTLMQGTYVSNMLGSACTFRISVAAVPDGLLQYGVQVGNHGVQAVSSSSAHQWVFLSVGP